MGAHRNVEKLVHQVGAMAMHEKHHSLRLARCLHEHHLIWV